MHLIWQYQKKMTTLIIDVLLNPIPTGNGQNQLIYERNNLPNFVGLIISCSCILTVHKVRILQKKLFKKTFFAFKTRVNSIQTVGYNGTRTVYILK